MINLILSNFHSPAWPDEAYLPNALTLRFNVECYQLKLKCDSQKLDTTVAVALLKSCRNIALVSILRVGAGELRLFNFQNRPEKCERKFACCAGVVGGKIYRFQRQTAKRKVAET